LLVDYGVVKNQPKKLNMPLNKTIDSTPIWKAGAHFFKKIGAANRFFVIFFSNVVFSLAGFESE
jgi:hypothetical protein